MQLLVIQEAPGSGNKSLFTASEYFRKLKEKVNKLQYKWSFLNKQKYLDINTWIRDSQDAFQLETLH